METRLESVAAPQVVTYDPHILRNVPILVIHAHSSCNCRCVMCDIWKVRDQKFFGLRELVPQIDSIRQLGVRWIVFSGGEPLMNPELPKMCDLLRTQGIRLTLLTTGLLLKKQACDVASGFDDVIVSLDGPPPVHNAIRRVDRAYELLQEGVESLRAKKPTMRIAARSTVQKANHSYLCETARTASHLGLQQVSFLAADLTSTAFNRDLVWPESRQSEIGLSLQEIATLEGEIESLIRISEIEFAPGFVAESAQKLRRLANHFRAHLGLEKPQSPPCNAPWVSAVVEADGTVRPCFFHSPIGRLHDAPLEAVLNTPKARAFRENLDIPSNPVCRNCVCSLNYRA